MSRASNVDVVSFTIILTVAWAKITLTTRYTVEVSIPSEGVCCAYGACWALQRDDRAWWAVVISVAIHASTVAGSILSTRTNITVAIELQVVAG